VSFAPEKTHGQEESRDSIGGLKTRDKFTEFLSAAEFVRLRHTAMPRVKAGSDTCHT
ncbi:hypothetical protein SeMB42_g06824, partial [Synchytrium endobioticum]